MFSYLGEQSSQISGETKNIFLLPKLTKERQSLPFLMPTTTASVISIKFCADVNGDLAKQYPCVYPVDNIVYVF